MRKYLVVFNLGLQNTFVYRWNYFLRAVFGLIPLAGTVFLWRAVFKEPGGGMHGYTYGSMIYYYLLTIVVSNLVTPTEDEWQIASDIRGGQMFLVDIMPAGIQAALKWLPFYYELFCPIAIFMERLRGGDMIQALAIQSGWLLLMWAAARYMWKRGLGHYQAVGG